MDVSKTRVKCSCLTFESGRCSSDLVKDPVAGSTACSNYNSRAETRPGLCLSPAVVVALSLLFVVSRAISVPVTSVNAALQRHVQSH